MTNELEPVRCGCGGVVSSTDYIGIETTDADGILFVEPAYRVFCRQCGISTPFAYRSQHDAITAWNRAMSGSAEEKLKAFWDGMSAEMKEERTAMVESSTITINPPNNIWKCGNCGQKMCETHFGNRIKYCSNCGARLEWNE